MSTHARRRRDFFAAHAAAHAAPLPGGDERPVQPLIQWFVVTLLVCQVALLVPELSPVRLLVRVVAFGGSLALLATVRGARRARHPAYTLAALTLLVVAVAVFHPETTNLVAGAAQAALYASVLAPVFWVPRLHLDTRVLRQTVLILWAFHTLSAALGVLQVYYPGSFQPPVSSIIAAKGKGYVQSLMIVTASGARVFRPMGLTDIPGGASISGLYAVLFGAGFFLTRRTAWWMAATITSMGLGMTALYLSQVRAVLVMTGISLAVMVAILARRGDVARLGMLGTVAGMVFAGGYLAALALAGPSVARRMASLTVARPGTVYYNERGHFLIDAFTRLLPEAPFGRGLGHWGMTASYFGRNDPGQVWVEIQWAGWIVDGGAPLALLYCVTIVAALAMAWRIASGREPRSAPDLPFWGAVVLAQGIGAFALTFSYPIFLSQPGMEFWLLNACLFAAARHAYGLERARGERGLGAEPLPPPPPRGRVGGPVRR
ncbi:MAG: hypothetical protein ACJ8J0_09640 [Longimicrobiaceae bacterium]